MSKELFIPMSSLQCAYMIERERGLKTTGTPCHVYMEFDTVSINETHLRKAWETLYVRHPMMRAKAEMCGLLKIEELNDREAERTIKIWEEDIFIKENMREILSHEKLDIRNGINCRLHLIKRHQKIVRLAFDLDLTMCDVLSFLIILRDLGEFYRYFKRGIIREYHSNEIEEEVLLSENRKSDKVYWEQRLRNSDIAFPLKVILTWRGIMNCINATQKLFSITSKDVAFGVTNYGHDMSIFDILGMVYIGGTTVIPNQHNYKNPEIWIDLMNKYKVTV